MKKITIALLLGCLLIMSFSCEKDKIISPKHEPRPEGWIYLNFEIPVVSELVLTNDWLYVCAAKDGLYRTELPASTNSTWEYLGLGDLDVVWPAVTGVMDVIEQHDTLLVGINSGNFSPEIPGIFCSFNDGESWIPSDSGFKKDSLYPGSGNVYTLAQSPTTAQRVLAGCGGGYLLYLSANFGKTWKMNFLAHQMVWSILLLVLIILRHVMYVFIKQSK